MGFMINSFRFPSVMEYAFDHILKSKIAVLYGLRRLRSDYNGSLIRVRRSSDNAEMDIGFDANGVLDIISLLAFAGSGSAYVKTAYDQNGSANHVTQTTLALQPRIVNAGVLDVGIGGKASMYANSSKLVFTSLLNPAQINTVLKLDSSCPDLGTLIASTEDHNLRRCITGGQGWRANTIADWCDYDTSYVNGALSKGTIDGNPAVLNTTNASTVLTFKKYSGFQVPPYFMGFNQLFYNNPNSGRFLKGYVSEISFFNTALSSEERTTLERNQGAYYGITVA